MNFPRSLGDPPKFGLREEIELVPVFTFSKHRCKRNATVVFVQVLKKSALEVQNLLFFIYSLGWLPASPSSLLPRFIDVRKRLWILTHFSKNACHLFTSQLYMLFKIRSINELLRFSGNWNLGGEAKKEAVVLVKKLFARNKQTWMNCALKVIIFRYFAFFLELTFYFLLFIHFTSFLCTTFSDAHVRTVRAGSYAPGRLSLLFHWPSY